MRTSTDPHAPRLLYSRAEAAFQWSLSVRAVDYLIAAGRVHTRKIGGRILVPHEELLRFAGSDRMKPILNGSSESQVASAA